jgi:hypothetical protein
MTAAASGSVQRLETPAPSLVPPFRQGLLPERAPHLEIDDGPVEGDVAQRGGIQSRKLGPDPRALAPRRQDGGGALQQAKAEVLSANDRNTSRKSRIFIGAHRGLQLAKDPNFRSVLSTISLLRRSTV